MSRNKIKPQKTSSNSISRTSLFRGVLIGTVLIYTLTLFSPVFKHQFTNWDDFQYITQNQLIRDFSFDGIINIFTTPVIGMYNPLPFLVYAISYKIWGLDPEIFHLINVIFHLMACYMIYQFIYQLTKRFETALIVMVLFAIHPMHVGVVAWASQTKTSMYALFYLAGLTQYIKYIQNNFRTRNILYAFLLFLPALLSKPSAVSFAPMLFVIDYYFSRKPDKRLFLEKIPFFLLSLCFGVITILTHQEVGDNIFEVTHHYSIWNSILVANYAITFYIEKLILPFNLSSIYPYPENTPLLPIKYYLCLLIIPALIYMVYKGGRFRKDMIFGLLFFLVAIAMVLRIVPAGQYAVANRYSYLSYTGLFFIIAQIGIYWYDHRFNYSLTFRKVWIYPVVIILLFSSWKTVKRVKVWESSITLFDDVIKKHPKFAMAYVQRGYSKADAGLFREAIADMTKAIELKPDYVDAYVNRGMFYAEIKEYESALLDYNMAIGLDPDNPTAYSNRGNLMLSKKDYESALIDLNTAINLDSEHEVALFNRGLVKINLSDTIGALNDWKHSSRLGFTKANEYINYYSSFQR